MISIIISVVMMGVVGTYCNLLFRVIGSEALAYEVNSMFLIHSPFDGVGFLTYPVIALIAIPIYLAIFVICAFFARKYVNAKK
jgi:hypothetical protein